MMLLSMPHSAAARHIPKINEVNYGLKQAILQARLRAGPMSRLCDFALDQITSENKGKLPGATLRTLRSMKTHVDACMLPRHRY